MSETKRCSWLPSDSHHHLTKPGMSDGDKAAWRARYGCQNPARWMIRSEGDAGLGMVLRPVASCTAHIGHMIKLAGDGLGSSHMVWPIDGAVPRPVQELIVEAVTAERARTQAEIDEVKRRERDLVGRGAARARLEYDELDEAALKRWHDKP